MLVYIPICPVYHYCSYWTYMFDHLAANGTGLTAGQVAIVALLQVDANLLGGLHLELVQGLTGLGTLILLLFLLDIIESPFHHTFVACGLLGIASIV